VKQPAPGFYASFWLLSTELLVPGLQCSSYQYALLQLLAPATLAGCRTPAAAAAICFLVYVCAGLACLWLRLGSRAAVAGPKFGWCCSFSCVAALRLVAAQHSCPLAGGNGALVVLPGACLRLAH
jgi:hypothetical protein